MPLECKAPAGELYLHLRGQAARNPALALACAELLGNAAQRDQILRTAFLAAVVDSPAVARQHVAQVMDRPWLSDAGFFALSNLAATVAPEQARPLLLKAARRYPALALREYRSYLGLPFGREVFETAALAAPDEAVGLANGHSATSQDVMELLRAGQSPELRWLASLPAGRQRAAVFFRSPSSATEGPGYFSAVASLRIAASGDDAALYDRVLENHAEVLFRGAQDNGSAIPAELRQLPARDVYLLLTYGRTEEDDLLFGRIFDALLMPKLRATPPAKLIAEAGGVNLRRFLSTAAAHHRLGPFLEAGLVERAIRGIDGSERPVDDMIEAAAILNAIQSPARLAQLQPLLVSEFQRGAGAQALYGLLAASVARKLTPAQASTNPAFQRIAAEYAPYFKEPRVLDAEALFDGQGRCLQQHLFYDDDDAADSFRSFRAIYQRDPSWQWEDREWYVRVASRSAAGRRIEIFANVPRSIRAGGEGDRRHQLAKLVAGLGAPPSVLVHRGHTWYVDQSLRYLAPACRLVYLGSCRGMMNAYAVIVQANQAQMIATNGVGTETVNDPLLKALNDELLRGGKTLDWDRFWLAQQARLGSNPEFRDYIPPPRNVAAIMLAAYYDLLAAGKVL